MDTLSAVYLGCLIVGLIYAVMSALAAGHGEIGDVGDIGGHDFDFGHDVGDIGDHGDIGGHASPLSPTVIACFVTGFGGFGIVGKDWMGLNGPMSALFGAVGGVIVGGAMFLFMGKVLYASQASSEPRQIDMIGLIAEVITPIPPGGRGEIAYILGGGRYTAAAMTEAPLRKEVTKGSTVRIKRVVGATVYVELE